MEQAADPSVDLKVLEESVKRLDALDKVGSAVDRDVYRELKEGVFVAAGAVLAISLLLLWRPEASGFISATASQVSVTSTRIDFAAQASWEGAYPRFSDGVFGEKKPSGYAVQQLRLSDIQQKSRVLRLEIGRVNDCDYFKVIEGTLVGVLWDLSGPVESAYPWRLAAEGRRSPVLTVCGTSRDTLRFRSRVTALALAREVNYGNLERGTEPVVREGTANLAQEKFTLSDIDVAFLNGDDGWLDLVASGEVFRIRYSGAVSSFQAGAPGAVTERLPNALQRLVTGSPLATLYSALAGLVAFIWGLRKIARNT
ncbi:MAG: hypothetical protein EOP38_07570 [Rubrivivax sp.]|nr:MAG: hypothetical protein EOP38_07570 [Rubrivivax sp.]